MPQNEPTPPAALRQQLAELRQTLQEAVETLQCLPSAIDAMLTGLGDESTPPVVIPPGWMPADLVQFGARVKRIREAHDMTQPQLSRACNVHFQTVSNIECGRYTHYKASTLHRLLQALANMAPVPTARLLAELGKAKPAPDAE